MTLKMSPELREKLIQYVAFPSQWEAEQRLLRARNRQRKWAARASLVLMALSPLATLAPINHLAMVLAGTGAVIFALCCFIGADANERKNG